MDLTNVPLDKLVAAYKDTLYEEWGWLGNERDRVIQKLVDMVQELEARLAKTEQNLAVVVSNMGRL